MTNTLITWEQGSTNPDNANNFATISQWWTGMHGREIAWKQRLLPSSGQAQAIDQAIDWELARFDEKFTLYTPQIRGITLYWRVDQKADAPEKSSTAAKLQLDTLQQNLYLYPQSQKELVIRIGVPEIIYQQFTLANPQIAYAGTSDRHTILLRDSKQQIEVTLTLNDYNLQELKTKLG
jgi:hypothetical protein